MLIVHAIHDFFPRYIMGAEVFCYNLSRELINRGHDVYIFAGDYNTGLNQYSVEEKQLDGLNCFYVTNEFQGLTKFSDTYENDTIARLFGETLDRVNPDVIHFHHVTRLSTTCVDEAKKRHIPILYKIADFWLQCHRGQRVKEDMSLCWNFDPSGCGVCNKEQIVSLEKFGKFRGRDRVNNKFIKSGNEYLHRLFAKLWAISENSEPERPLLETRYQQRNRDIKEMMSKVDLFTAPSKFLREEYVKWGIPAEKIIYLDNGFDKRIYRNITKTKSDKLRFAHIGAIIPTKGVDVAIKAFNELQDRNVELKIYGNPYIRKDYYDMLVKLANKNNIKFVGELENHKVPEAYKEIDVLIIPSIWFENSPLTIHEALMARTPVIASNIGGMAEYVKDGVTGFHFEVGNYLSLKSKIEKIIDDPSVLSTFDFDAIPVKSIEEATDELEKIYTGLIEKCKY